MRKFTRFISLVLILASLLGLCSGCMQDEGITTIKFGIPFKKDSDNWVKIQNTVDDINMFKEDYDIVVELVEVPSDKKERKQFLKEMDSGSVAMFMYDRDELVDKYIKSGRIASLVEIQEKYPACYEEAKPYMLDTSTDSDGMNHMLALAGEYQGVFFNEDIFVANGLKIPKTWEQFTASIETLKAAGVTPIAAGFADDGLTYWMDELILMEGGVAEHSYIPKYGVVNSWARAMDDFKGLYNIGAFNADCMETKHADAVKMFNEGKAAMIVSPSSKVVTDDMDVEKAGVFALPVTATGKKNIGDAITDFSRGIYINTSFLKKETDVIDTMMELVINYLNLNAEEDEDAKEEGEDYGPPIPSEFSYYTYAEKWMCPANPYTIGIEQIIYDENWDIIEDTTDPSVQDEIKEKDDLNARVFNLLEDITDAGRPITTNFKNVDFFVEQVKEYTLKNGDAAMREALLLEVTEKEMSK